MRPSIFGNACIGRAVMPDAEIMFLAPSLGMNRRVTSSNTARGKARLASRLSLDYFIHNRLVRSFQLCFCSVTAFQAFTARKAVSVGAVRAARDGAQPVDT